MNNFDDLERQLRDSAPTLPPHLRSGVLNSCAAKRREQSRCNRRVNFSLTLAFGALCAVHWLIVGQLDAQRSQLLGGNATLVAARPSDPARVQLALQMRARMIAALNDSHSQPF